MVTDPLENEVWKTLEIRGEVVGFSSLGSFQDSNGIRKTVTSSKGEYCSVGIDSKHFQFHNLMCTAFRGDKPSPDHEADHIDLNPTNNRPDNLRWFTPAENIQESYRLNKNRKSHASQQSLPVLGRKHKSTDEWVLYSDLSEASRQFGGKSGAVSAVMRGKRNHAGGFEFKLAPSPNLLGEVWKPMLVNGKNIQVSSLGRFIDSLGRRRTPAPNRSGYCRVEITRKTFSFHRLVCEAFWGPPPSPELQCNHKDLNRANNNYLNLEWVTRQKNIQESYRLNKNRRSSAPKRSKPVYGRKHKTKDEWVEYPSMNEAARKLDLKVRPISGVTKGRRNQTGGYEFKLKLQE